MIYKGYTIERDATGCAPKDYQFSIFTDDGEKYIDSAATIEECENLIDELLKLKHYETI